MTTARLPGLVGGAESPALPAMDPVEVNRADLWATGVSPDSHPMQFVREELAAAGVVTAAGLADIPAGRHVRVGGVVTHRQRPATAQGVTFVNLEDETGLVNVICSQGVWVRFRRVARAAPALVVAGRLEKVAGPSGRERGAGPSGRERGAGPSGRERGSWVINLVAQHVSALRLPPTSLSSRDFR